MKHSITISAYCKDCKGTGLYVGFAERDGSAVVCHTCKGTGGSIEVIEWEDFEGRKPREEVITVLQTNPGIVVGGDLQTFGGMPYEDWRQGKLFPPKSEMRRFTCPAWWYQSADSHLKPKWVECISIGMFSDCKYFPTKDLCWEQFDKQ